MEDVNHYSVAATVERIQARKQALSGHPDYTRACQICAIGLVGLYRGNRLLNRILNDRGRAVFGLFALYLDATPDERGVGLTVTRIANLCHDTGICSRGRAKAIVTLMRWGGYLTVGPDSGPNRRQRPLVPTDLMLEQQVLRWRTLFGALQIIHPPAAEALRRIEDPAFGKRLIREVGGRFHAGFRLHTFAPEAMLFAERDAGLLIAWTLVTSGAPGDVFPPEQPIPVAVATLARQFFVSRAHVLKLLREAEQAGLIERTASPAGSMRLLPPMRQAMLDLLGALLACFADVAAIVMETEDQEEPASTHHLAPRPSAVPFSGPYPL